MVSSQEELVVQALWVYQTVWHIEMVLPGVWVCPETLVAEQGALRMGYVEELAEDFLKMVDLGTDAYSIRQITHF